MEGGLETKGYYIKKMSGCTGNLVESLHGEVCEISLTGKLKFDRVLLLIGGELTMPEGKSFSNNEVMALIESFKNDIKVIAEDTTALREDMTEVKERLSGVEVRLTGVEDAVRGTLPRLTKLEVKLK